MKTRSKANLIYGLTLAGILSWLALLVLAPYLRSQGNRLNSLIYAAFAPTCHQIPSRCFHIFGYPMAVCGRCTGIYAGFLAGLLAFPLLLRGLGRATPPPSLFFILLTIPIGVDAAGNFFGLWSTGNGLRFATGLIWGSILPFYFVAGMNSLFLKRRSPRPKQTLE